MTLLASRASAVWVLFTLLQAAAAFGFNASTVLVGGSPEGVAVNPLTHEVFIVDTQLFGALSVLDGRRRDRILARYSPMIAPAEHLTQASSTVLVNALRNRAYVLNYVDSGGTVTMVNRGTGDTVETGIGIYPDGMALNSTTNRVYVSHGLSGEPGVGGITVLDGETLTTHEITTGVNPVLAVDELHNRIYAAIAGDNLTFSNTVTVIDGDTEAKTDVAVAAYPFRVAVDALRDEAWVVNGGPPAEVSIIEASAGFAVKHISLENASAPCDITVNPTLARAFVLLCDSSTLVEIDENTLAQTSIQTGHVVSAVDVDPIHNRIYVLQEAAQLLTVIDGESLATQDFRVGQAPAALALDSELDTAYVSNTLDGTVTVVQGPAAPCFRCLRLVPFRAGAAPAGKRLESLGTH